VDAEDMVRQKWRLLKATMGERARRLWAGAEAGALGYGGVVVEVSGARISLSRGFDAELLTDIVRALGAVR